MCGWHVAESCAAAWTLLHVRMPSVNSLSVAESCAAAWTLLHVRMPSVNSLSVAESCAAAWTLFTDLQLMDGWPRSDKPVIAWRRLKPQEVVVG